MVNLIDLTNCENGYKSYGGSDGKISLKYNGDNYLVKFSSDINKINEFQTSHANNVISEHLSSKIISTLGIPVHETFLAIYKNELVVACKDFTNEKEKLHEFSWYMKNIYRKDQIGRTVTYNQLYEVFEESDLNKIKDDAISSYWDMFVCDAFIGNFDRHKDNWGYLVDEKSGNTRVSPIYDCGSSLYSEISDESIPFVLKSEDEINKRLFEFPKAALLKNDDIKHPEKFGYYELLSSGVDKNCEKSLLNIVPKINIDDISRIVNDIPVISDLRKEFYITMLSERYNKILIPSYEQALNNNNEYYQDIENGL